MAVTVLGGAGFIGSNIVDELVIQGFDVTVLDNFSEGKVENLENAKRMIRDGVGNAKKANLEIIRGDICDYDLVRRVTDNRFCVFHLAAMSRIQPSIVDPLSAWRQNMIGTGNVLEACRQGNVKRVVYSASSSAYGRINKPPMVEGMPTDCLNPYSLSKKVGEEMMDLYQKLYGLSTVSLRYFNVYGPRHQEEGSYATVIAIFRKQKKQREKLTIVGDGTQRRDFTFVGDVVRANMLAMMDLTVNGMFNIGTGKNYSINEVAELIGGETVNIPPRLGEAQVTLACYDKAKEVLGWEPKVSLKDGLALLDDLDKKSNLIVTV